MVGESRKLDHLHASSRPLMLVVTSNGPNGPRLPTSILVYYTEPGSVWTRLDFKAFI